MIKRLPVYVILILILAMANGTCIYARQDTNKTHSLDDFSAVDTVEIKPVDSSAIDEEAETDTAGAAVDSIVPFTERFALKQIDTLSATRRFPASAIKKIKDDEDFWYANRQIPKEAASEESGSSGFWESVFKFFANKAVRTVIWILMIAVLAAAFIMYLVNNKISLFGSPGKKIKQAAGEPGLPENIFDIDFDFHISNALKDADYRVATRLLFLRMLKTMSEKNLLHYSIDKTNMDYLFELNGTQHFKDFATASRNYEYVWYGNFNITQEQFGNLKNSFEKFSHY